MWLNGTGFREDRENSSESTSVAKQLFLSFSKVIYEREGRIEPCGHPAGVWSPPLYGQGGGDTWSRSLWSACSAARFPADCQLACLPCCDPGGQAANESHPRATHPELLIRLRPQLLSCMCGARADTTAVTLDARGVAWPLRESNRADHVVVSHGNPKHHPNET